MPFVRVDSDGVFSAHDNHPPGLVQGTDGREGQEIKVVREHVWLFKKKESFLDVFAQNVTGVSVGTFGIKLLFEKLWDGEFVGMNPGEVLGFGISDFQIVTHSTSPCVDAFWTFDFSFRFEILKIKKIIRLQSMVTHG